MKRRMQSALPFSWPKIMRSTRCSQHRCLSASIIAPRWRAPATPRSKPGVRRRPQNILMQIDEINALPDRSGGFDRSFVGKGGVAVEIGSRVAECRSSQREETVDVPAQQDVLIRVQIDREVEKVRDIRNG